MSEKTCSCVQALHQVLEYVGLCPVSAAAYMELAHLWHSDSNGRNKVCSVARTYKLYDLLNIHCKP